MRQLMIGVFLFVITGVSIAGQVDEFINRHPQGSGKVMLENMEKKSVSAKHKEQLIEAVMNHAKKGVPSGPLVDKVNEGLQKNVDPARIVKALSKVAERYTVAAKMSDKLDLDKKDRETVTANFAHSMAAGLSKADAGRIAEAAKANQMDVKSTVQLSSLAKTAARAGVVSKDVAALSVACVEQNVSKKELKSIQKSFREFGRYGQPSALAKGYISGVRKGYKGASLAGYAQGSGSGNGKSDGSGSRSSSGSGSGSGGNGNGGNGSGGNGNGNGGPR